MPLSNIIESIHFVTRFQDTKKLSNLIYSNTIHIGYVIQNVNLTTYEGYLSIKYYIRHEFYIHFCE